MGSSACVYTIIIYNINNKKKKNTNDTILLCAVTYNIIAGASVCVCTNTLVVNRVGVDQRDFVCLAQQGALKRLPCMQSRGSIVYDDVGRLILVGRCDKGHKSPGL